MAAWVASVRREVAGERVPVAKIRRIEPGPCGGRAGRAATGGVLEEGIASGQIRKDIAAADVVATIFLKGVSTDGV